MNSPRQTISGFIGFVALVSPQAASAGEFGATSRGAISISVTVPPRVAIAIADRDARSGRGGSPGWCVRTSGLQGYHVRVVGTSTPIDSLAACQDRPDTPLSARAMPARVEGTPPVPLSILIVPD